MIVRPAIAHDVPECCALGRRFTESVYLGELVGYDDESATALLTHMIDNDDGILLVVEIGADNANFHDAALVGMAGAILYPFYFNRHHKTGQELFWYIEPEHRNGRSGIELLEAMEAEALAKGARSFMMVALEKQEPERLAKFYERHGYEATERIFTRTLAWQDQQSPQ